MRLVRGVPVSWDPHNAATRRYPNTKLAVWSPCNRFIAISQWDATKVYTLDSATLQQLQSLEFPPRIPASSQALIFSPDGRILTCSGGIDRGVFIISWDLQTGGVVSAITRRGPGGQKGSRHQQNRSVAVRLCGCCDDRSSQAHPPPPQDGHSDTEARLKYAQATSLCLCGVCGPGRYVSCRANFSAGGGMGQEIAGSGVNR